MKILLIHWQMAENNPFEFFNTELSLQFKALGCIVSTLVFDDNFADKITNYEDLDLAISWQGVASNICTDDGCNIWEKIKVPLVCLHGDHPCHKPANHSADSVFVHHIYTAPSFAKYSNTYFKRSRPAIFQMLPNFFRLKNDHHSSSGDFFVLPKNLDSVSETLSKWGTSLRPTTSQFLIEAAQVIMDDYDKNAFIDHHATVDTLLTNEVFDRLKSDNNVTDELALFHDLHKSLDKIYRNYASEKVIEDLSDFPLKVVGRGWDKYIKRANKRHEFLDFDSVASGDWQFSSSYGIVDIAPAADSLHDRFFRALAQNGAVTSNSLICNTGLLSGGLDSIFYRTNDGKGLRRTAEKILVARKEHLDSCKHLSRAYQEQYSFYDFYSFLTRLL
jgi:hypothetical protein